MNKSRRRWVVAGILAILAVILCYPLARNAWLYQRAEKSFSAGEDRKAVLQAMHILQLSPSYTPAAGLVADISEKNLSRDALRWRKYAVNKDPSTKNQISLARTCIHFNELEWADEALRSVKEKERQTSLYMQTVASLALAMHRNDEAAYFFNKALEFEPGNKDLLLNLSILRLTLRDPGQQSKGRQELQDLKKDSRFTIPATIALLQDARANRGPVEILARELLAQPSPSFSDRLIAFDALTELGVSDSAELLADFQKRVADQPDEIYILANRMVRQNHPVEAKRWLDSLKPEIRSKFPVPMAYADCLVSLRDWKTLQDQVSHEKWPDAEILRHAFLWRSQRETNPVSQSENGQSEWKKVLRGEVRPAELYLVANLFWSWGWKSEAEDLWWNLAEQTINPEIALKRLDQIARADKNTSKLWRISQLACRNNPRDKIAQNNYAMLSLLLNLDQKNARNLAESLYNGQAQSPAFLSTQAFSLYRQGKTKEALKLFSTLDPKVLEDPSFAFYYAVFLKADGQDAESARYAKRGANASLLAEEKALLQ